MGNSRHLTGLRPDPPSGEHDDRRRVCRYAVIQDHGLLGWWEGESFRYSNAKLLDISLRGASMTVEFQPPTGQPTWFCPPGATSIEWVEATLVGSKKRLFGPIVARIAFRVPFPYDRFKEAVNGPAGPLPEPMEWLPVESPKRDWW